MDGLGDIKFDDKGLVPAIVQDADTGEILMMAWMNEESLNRTVEQGTTWFWSRIRQEFWKKGATSGNQQHVTDVRYDFDADILLVKVHADAPALPNGDCTGSFRFRTSL